MRIATWNVYLAPLMPRRQERLPLVLQTLTQLVQRHGAEVVVLQELHGYRCGPVAAWLQRWLPPGRITDLLSIVCSRLEGWCGKTAPVQAPYREAVVAHAATLGLGHVVTTEPPAQHAGVMDCGVVVLASSPLSNVQTVAMASDGIHTPGCVGAQVGHLTVWGCHLLPRLPPTRWEYRLVRALHAVWGIDANAIGNQNVQQLRRQLRPPALIVGDMNTTTAVVGEQCPELHLLTPNENTLCPLEPEGPTCLDHGWGLGLGVGSSGYVIKADGAGLLADRIGADHYPVVVEVSAT